MEVMWSPWHGCHKCSPGCKNCYVYNIDKNYDKDSSFVTKSKTNFDLPLKKKRDGSYKIPLNSIVKTCFTSDFFIEEADSYRNKAWEMIKFRKDSYFIIPTKRVERIKDCLPKDWKSGYNNVIIALTCENQEKADLRIPLFLELPIKHRNIFVSPILEYVDLKKYLKTKKIEKISVGGESYTKARICDFKWVEKIYVDCLENSIDFDFHQTGSNFLFNNKLYKINHKKEFTQAKKGKSFLNKKYNKKI